MRCCPRRPAAAATVRRRAAGCSSSDLLALLLGEPDHLERVVAFDEAVLVVVDRLAGPRQQPRRGVVLAQDQLRVGVRALQRDADRHLVDGAAGQRVGPAERLRAEQDVQPERPALPHEPVEQAATLPARACRPRRRTPGTRRRSSRMRGRLLASAVRGAVAGEVVDAGVAELVAALLQDAVEPLQHAQAELALALDGDDAGVRQAVRRVPLELDALLEVDEVQLDFVRAVSAARGS